MVVVAVEPTKIVEVAERLVVLAFWKVARGPKEVAPVKVVAAENVFAPLKVWVPERSATFAESAASEIEADGRVTTPAVTERPEVEIRPLA